MPKLIAILLCSTLIYGVCTLHTENKKVEIAQHEEKYYTDLVNVFFGVEESYDKSGEQIAENLPRIDAS